MAEDYSKEMIMFSESLKELPLKYLSKWYKLCDCHWRKFLIKKEIERRLDMEE